MANGTCHDLAFPLHRLNNWGQDKHCAGSVWHLTHAWGLSGQQANVLQKESHLPRLFYNPGWWQVATRLCLDTIPLKFQA